MRAGIITGSGSYEWPSLAAASATTVSTRFGDVDLTEGTVGAVEVVHLARHGSGHARLSNQIQHHANLTALIERGVDFVISLSVCGALDPAAELGSLVFDDLYFPSNRLPDGSLCTWHDVPGAAGRGHWILTIQTGWWTTCLEILPPRERSTGRYHLYRSSLPDGFTPANDGWGATPEIATDGELPVIPLFGSPFFPARLWIYTNFHCNLVCDYCAVASSPKARARSLSLERFRTRVDEAVTEGVRRALPDRR